MDKRHLPLEKETIAYRFLLALFLEVDTLTPEQAKGRIIAARQLWEKYIDNEEGNLHTDQQPTAQQPRASVLPGPMVDAQ